MSNMIDFQKHFEVLKEFTDLLFAQCMKYLNDTVNNVCIGIVVYVIICILFYIISVLYRDTITKSGRIDQIKRALFVTAHPDDECMFFGPTILELKKKEDCQIYLLCLSDGNFDKRGSMRKNELWDACALLGIPDSNISVMKSEYLPDDPGVRWREDIVGNFLLNHIESLCIDTVITFDKQGISGHLNHNSLFYGVASLCMEKKLPTYCRAYALESINLFRKYSFFLDVPISYLLSRKWYIVSFKDRKIIRAAMKAHDSQYVWFRQLYMHFSRYTYINTLKEIEIVDLELDMDLDD